MPSNTASPSTPSNLRGYIYLAAVSFVFLQAGLYSSRRTTTASSPWLASTPTQPEAVHPITQLMADAEASYRRKLGRQSKTLKHAVGEYHKRHGRAPPKGFDKWWAFAQANGVRLVDEYDGVVGDLAPFWELSSAEFRARVQEASLYPAMDLVRIRGGEPTAVTVENGVEIPATSGRSAGFMAMLQPFLNELPDLDIAVNTRIESRILPPWEAQSANRSLLTRAISGDPFSPDWAGQGSVWEAYRVSCPPSTGARALYSSLRPAFVGQPSALLRSLAAKLSPSYLFRQPSTTFVRAPASTALDFCASPHAHFDHGHFFSDWRTIPRLLPVFSPARARGFGDVRVPSHYYYWPARRHTYGYDALNLVVDELDKREVPWERKSDKVFWRGPTTGGGVSPPGYSERYHRHRFIRAASDNSTANHTVVFADPSGAAFASAQVPVRTLNARVLDAAFTKTVYEGAYPGGPDALRRDHRFVDEAAPLGEHWAHKYLLDLDGMGYSAKFFALMESESAVVKATVFDEFWSDWAQPWLHYIPLSEGYREIYNIHAYFSGPVQAALDAANVTIPDSEPRTPHGGDARLRRIARAGKHWRKTIARNVDMEAYVFRLCLEYARLWADDRESMDFKL